MILRLVFAGVVLGCAVLTMFMGAPPGTARAQTSTVEKQLAEKYAPIAYLRNQRQSCDRDGEAYFPASVESVLDNPDVVLRQITGRTSSEDAVVKIGPTAQDLAGLDDSYYLDFPGNPRRPGCEYEADFQRFVEELDLVPTTYSRIVVDEEAGKLVLQYFLWYYFNDWNNLHEGDWERVQLVFDTSSTETALTQAPVQIGFAQHGGGELAAWDDDKLALEADHPLIYPAAGSHGTYFEEQLYIGWGENGTGVGCDDSNTPNNRVPLEVIMMPGNPTADGPFGWLLYEGRWGERQPWEFNGPRGPNSGSKWTDPLDSTDNWRTFSLFVPGSKSLGSTPTDLFCSIVESGSSLVAKMIDRPRLLVATLSGFLLAIVGVFYVGRKELSAAFTEFRRNYKTFLGIGLATIPIGFVFNGFYFLVNESPPLEWLINWLNDTTAARLFAGLLIGGIQQIVMILVITPPVVYAINENQAGRSPGSIDCFKHGFRLFWPLLTALVINVLTVGILLLTLIGTPVAIWLGVRWQFCPQAAILDEAKSGSKALRMSAAAVDGKWWETLRLTLLFQLLLFLPGPMIGMLLLVFGKTTVQFANGVSSLVYAVVAPLSVIGLTLAYQKMKRQPVRERLQRRGEEALAPTGAP